MKTATWSKWWNGAWRWHDQAKELLRFTIGKTTFEKASQVEPSSQSPNDQGEPPRKLETSQKVGLILGPLLFILTFLFANFPGLNFEAKAVLASTLWIATWWTTEAIPIPATSLLPIILFPLTGISEMKVVTASYGDSTIFLFLGGFILALAMERWNVHKRVALNIISWVGTNTERIILGTMVATGFLSMWISNTATTMMMMPIGIAIIYQMTETLKEQPGIQMRKSDFPLSSALMLGIAYSASIGGEGLQSELHPMPFLLLR